MPTGVHCSVRNGFAAAAFEASGLGCETFQMFTQRPRGWRTRVYTDEDFRAFRDARDKLGLNPVVLHSPYLPNLCTSDEPLYQKSLLLLKQDLDRTNKLGAEFLVIHPGAYSPNSDVETGLNRLGNALNEALTDVPGSSKILIENMAGGGRRLGGTFHEIAEMIKRVKDQKRMGVCFDTCHAIGAGYDISQVQGIEATLAEFDREIGLEWLQVFHVNDSETPCGSHRDLHEHIGQGTIGKQGFKEFFKRLPSTSYPFILETPKWPVPQADLTNLKELRECLSWKTKI